MSGRLAVRIALLVTVILVTGAFPAPSEASTIRIACYGWDSAPVGCFDEATDDTLACSLPNLVGPEGGGSIYYFGFISMDNDQFCDLQDTEPDSNCAYDLTAWFEPGAVAIGHVVGPGGGDQNARIQDGGWQGHVPTDFTAIRLEYQQRTPCNDIRTIVIPIRWMPAVPSGGEGSIVAWGYNEFNQCNVPPPNADFVEIAGGGDHSLGLRSDGTVVTWGRNDYGECDVPDPIGQYLAVAAGLWHSLALRADGAVVAWGQNSSGQCDIPSPNANFIAITGGRDHSLGLRLGGTVVAWGLDDDGQCDVPDPNNEFVAVSAGVAHSLGLKSSGTVVAWGLNNYGQCDVPAPNSDYVAIASGQWHSLGLKSDRTIIAWGLNWAGQCDVPAPNEDFVAVAGGGASSLGLKSDGSIVAWGWNEYGQCDVPEPPHNASRIAAGGYHSLALSLTGACCLSAYCLRCKESECTGYGGVYMGNGTLCEPNPCVSAVDDASQVTSLNLTASPNPSTGQVMIRYSLPKPTAVTIEVFNAAGSLVRRLAEGHRPAGAFSTPWDGRDDNGRDMPTGVYFARIVAGQGTAMGRAVIAK